LTAEFHSQRKTVLQLPGRLVDVSDLPVGLADLISEVALLHAQVVELPSTTLHLLVHREAEIKHTANQRQRNRECYELGAGTDFTNELARKFTQEHFRVIAPGGRRRFYSRCFDERCDVRLSRGGGYDCGQVPNGKEVQHQLRVFDAKLVAVADFAARRYGFTVERQCERRVKIGDAV